MSFSPTSFHQTLAGLETQHRICAKPGIPISSRTNTRSKIRNSSTSWVPDVKNQCCRFVAFKNAWCIALKSTHLLPSPLLRFQNQCQKSTDFPWEIISGAMDSPWIFGDATTLVPFEARCPNKLTTSSSQCSAFEEPEMYAIPPPIPGRAQLFKHKKTCSWQVLPSALDNLVNFQQARLSLTPMYRWLGTWKVRRIRFTPCKSTKVKRIYFTHVWRGMLWKYSSLLPYQFEAAKSIRFISEKIQVHIPSSVSCFLIRQSALQVGRVGLSIFRFESCVCLSVSVSGCLYPSVCLKKSVKRSVPRLSYHIIPMIHTLVSQSAMPSGSSNLGGCLQGFSLRAHPTHMWTSPSLPGLYPPKVCSQWTSNRIFPPRGSSATALILHQLILSKALGLFYPSWVFCIHLGYQQHLRWQEA